MKKLFSLAMIFALPIVMIACAKKNEDSTVASTPLTTTCLTGQVNCNNNQWMNYQQYGFAPYPSNPYILGGYNTGLNTGGLYGGLYGGTTYQQQIQQNLCACGYGYQTVYHNGIGLGCMQTQTGYQSYTGMTAYWYISSVNNSWVNIPQVSNQTQNFWGSSCNGAVAQACSVGQAGNCSTGTACVPNVPGSPIGLCIRQ